jgi:4-hydroxy-tetrahydrodipicolinate reductase
VIRVGVVGAAGKMGRQVLAAVAAAPDLEISCAVDPRIDEVTLDSSIVQAEDLTELPDGVADVLVDFTRPDAARQHLAATLRRGFHLVVGTTGIGPDELRELEAAAEASGANAVVAANFAIGAVLLLRFARQAAPYFDGVEIIELHHDQKLDAPSGTSIATANAIAEARAEAQAPELVDPTTTMVLDGARGAKAAGAVPIHSVRLPGLVAHEEVIFGAPGQGLTLRHDSYDRISFMSGVLVAIRQVPRRSGVTVGLESLLDD